MRCLTSGGGPWARLADVSLGDGRLQVRQTLQRVGGDRVRLRTLRAERRELTARWRNCTDEETRARLAQERARLWTEIQAVRRHFSLGEPKSARSRRTINLPAIVVKALRAHRARQLEERLAAGGDWQDMGLVFTTRRGTPLLPSGRDPRCFTQSDLRRHCPQFGFTISAILRRPCCWRKG
jgi:hypothetical protein